MTSKLRTHHTTLVTRYWSASLKTNLADGASYPDPGYRIIAKSDTGVTCVKVYYPQDGPIRVHQSRVCLCPQDFPAGYFWYGGKRRGPGRPPRWVEDLLRSGTRQTFDEPSNGDSQVEEVPYRLQPECADMQPQGFTAGHSPTAPLHSPVPQHNIAEAIPLADLDENFRNEAGNVYEGQLQGDGVSSLSALGPQPDQSSETAPDPLDISQDPPEGAITAPSNRSS